jgi:hypothetical protein
MHRNLDLFIALLANSFKILEICWSDKIMKTKKVTREVEIYICGVCKKEYDIPYRAEECEQKHKRETCKHKHVKYELCNCGYDGGYDAISKKCLDCGTVFLDMELDVVLNDKTLKKLYEGK